MNKQELTGQRAIAIFLLATVAFSPIFLLIFSKPVFFLGLPQLYLYIFAVWGLVILAIGINVYRIKSEDGKPLVGSAGFSDGRPVEPGEGSR